MTAIHEKPAGPSVPPAFDVPDPESLQGLDRVIAAYATDVDETILIENLRLTPQQRFDKFVRFMRFVQAVRGSAATAPAPSDIQGEA